MRIKLALFMILATLGIGIGPTLLQPTVIRGGTAGRVLIENGTNSLWSPSPTSGWMIQYNGSTDTWAAVHALIPCRVATTANLSATYANGTSGVGATLTNNGTQAAMSIDGVSLSSGDPVLVKNQSTGAQNGIYTVTTVGSNSTNWVLTRRYDFNSASNVICGETATIQEGTANAGTEWYLSTATETAPTLGTTSLSFAQLGSVTSVAMTVPAGLSISGSPITTGGTLGLTWSTETANTFFAGPSSGAAATPTWRAIATADLGTGSASSSTYLRGDLTWATVSGGGSPGGANTDVQYNSSGSFAGDAGMTYGGQSVAGILVGLSPTSTSASAKALAITRPASFAGYDFYSVDSSSNLVFGVGPAITGLDYISPTSSSSGPAFRIGLNAYATSGNQDGALVALAGTAGSPSAVGGLSWNAAENQSSGHLGTDAYLSTVAVGATSRTIYWKFTANGNALLNATGSAVSTSASDGFLYVPYSSGNPGGSPTAYTGAQPLCYDNTNGGLWVNGGTWAPIYPMGAQTVNNNTTVGTGGGSGNAGAISWTFVSVSGKSVTLPSAANLAGKMMGVKNTFNSGTTTVKASSGNIENVAGSTGVSVTSTSGFGYAVFVSDGTNWWAIAHNTAF